MNVFTENQTRKGSQPYFSTVYDVSDPPVLSPGHDEQDDNEDRPKAGGGHDDPGHPRQQEPRHGKQGRLRLKVRFTPVTRFQLLLKDRIK